MPALPRIAVLPSGLRPWVAEAVRSGGAVLAPAPGADALVWTATGFEPDHPPEDLVAVLKETPAIRWILLQYRDQVLWWMVRFEPGRGPDQRVGSWRRGQDRPARAHRLRHPGPQTARKHCDTRKG